MVEDYIIEYRVETRDKINRGSWIPENGLVFTDLAKAEVWRDEKRTWYSNPDRFEQRITSRQVTAWEPIMPAVSR